MATWGTLGATLEIEGASGRTWTLRFERRIAPRPSATVQNPASSVWLVRHERTFYAAKRQALASLPEVDTLVDEAAAWRSACLADKQTVTYSGEEGADTSADDAPVHIVELVDVFVQREAPFSVTFLAEFCSRGLLPRTNISEPVLLTLVADLAAAAAVIPSPHAHIAYDSLLVDANGRIRLAGFGAHRSAIIRDNPGLTPADDAFDIGVLIFELVFGHAPPDDLAIPTTSSYSSALLDIIHKAFSHPHPAALRDAALQAGAEPRAPVIDLGRKRVPDEDATTAPEHVARATERNVDRLLQGIDIAPTFAALLSDLNVDGDAVASSVFKALFAKPVGKDPLCAVRAFTMLHNLMLDGPAAVLVAVRGKDRFMEWAETSWSKEAVAERRSGENEHEALVHFAGGELEFYASFLRRKARFHQLALGGFTASWNRTGVTDKEGRDALLTRSRKVVNGMADLAEMASELGCLFAGASDPEAPAKHAGIGAMVSECCLGYNAAVDLVMGGQLFRDVKKCAPGLNRLYVAARALVFAVEHVPTAGGEQWVQQFVEEHAPDFEGDFMAAQDAKEGGKGSGEFPAEGWEGVEVGAEGGRGEKTEKKKQKKKKKKEKEQEETVGSIENEDGLKDSSEAATQEITANDGALVVHGADEASKAVTTMFGDLLRIDGDREDQPAEETQMAPPVDNMTNAQALASAFGVQEDLVADIYEHEQTGAYDDEEDGGGYEDYQARQEVTARAAQIREARGPSTAAWAARAGYGSRALVVSDVPNVKKSHPVFCQCAICQQEEAQAKAAEESALRGSNQMQYGDGYGKDGGGTQHREEAEDVYREDDYAKGSYGGGYGGNDDADSLDEDDGGKASWNGRNERQQGGGQRQQYYDDYDSYESVTYSVDRNKPGDYEREVPAAGAIPLGEAPTATLPRQRDSDYGAEGNGVGAPTLNLTKKQILNVRRLRIGDKLSDGDLIVVHQGEYNGETVAVKKLTKKGMQSPASVNEFCNEVRVMCALKHMNVVPCVAACVTKPNLVFVTALMKRGTLFDVLHKNRIKLTWAMIRKISLQIAQGMEHLHEHGFIHRDLKSLNVFTDGGYNVKIGDFGLACHVSESEQNGGSEVEGICGTYQYMAPEVLRGEPHSFKSDVFAFAVLLSEMVSGAPPFIGVEPRLVAERVVHEDIRPTIPMHCQRSVVNIIQQCWATVPSTRPSFEQVVKLIETAK